MSDPIYVLVDAGNSRIKWGVLDGTGIVKTGAIPTADAALLHGEWGGTVAPKHMVASKVAGDSVEAHLEHTCENAGMTLRMVRSEAEQLGVVNGYRDPAQLGSDRWAALIAAHHGGKGHKLVVNVGTALTIDALAEGGRFLGGLIVPGPALMRQSLDRGTAGLRLTEGALHDFPESTPDAITSGAIQACVGAILRMHGVMTAQGMAPRQVILSGGAAAELAPHLPLAPTLRENLVLEGLALVARAP